MAEKDYIWVSSHLVSAPWLWGHSSTHLSCILGAGKPVSQKKQRGGFFNRSKGHTYHYPAQMDSYMNLPILNPFIFLCQIYNLKRSTSFFPSRLLTVRRCSIYNVFPFCLLLCQCKSANSKKWEEGGMMSGIWICYCGCHASVCSSVLCLVTTKNWSDGTTGSRLVPPFHCCFCPRISF